jgi:D-alanyl-D-alanine dipeptidase
MSPAICFCIFAAITGVGQVKTVIPPAPKIPFTQSLQALVVITKGWTTIQGQAHFFERSTASAKWKPVGDEFPVVVGRNGLAWDDDTPVGEKLPFKKREGDGKSPAGLMPLTAAFGSSTKSDAIELPYTRLAEFTECVDDVNSSHYNKIVDRMQVGNFDWKSSEKMLAVGEQYGLGVFVGYNSFPAKRGNGSCIFLHIWKDAASGTSGCTAMERRNLESIVARFQPEKNPYLVQMPEEIYRKHRKTWNLPKIR